jgi:pSer/pThr/pTyr-binding forkhead associated (FHA) protein
MASGPQDKNSVQNQGKPSDSGLVPESQTPKKILVLKVAPSTKEGTEKVLKFDKERIVIGSVVSADVRLTGDGISPIHAVLEMSQDTQAGTAQGTIFDLASETGVFVNNQKVIAHKLSNSEELTIGKHKIKFSIEDFKTATKSDPVRKTGNRTLFLNPGEDLTPLLLEDEREVEEIFDFRPTSKPALEIVMSWFGTILAIEHFVHEKKVTIGDTQKSDFGIPPLLSSNHYPIVTQNGSGFVLNLDGNMKGVMQRAGELKNLDEIRSQTMRGPNGCEVSIGNNDFAKITIGNIDFYFSYTAGPPKLKRRRIFERDPFFSKVFFTSTVLTLLAIFTLSKMKLQTNVDAEQVPERIATILYQPEKFMQPPPVPKPKPKPTQKPTPQVTEKPVEKEPPQPKPTPKQTVKITPKAPSETKKPLPKVMQVQEAKKPAPEAAKAPPATAKPSNQNRPAPKAEAKEGEGARAKGAEGSRGEKNQPKAKDKVTELSRPSPKTGAKGAAGDSHISDEGNVDILKGAGGKIQNILGNSAAHLGEGSENLKGFGNFATRGNGGLALSGSGHGGGGDAETTLGGLGKKGSGMGRVGTGKGAAGNGNGIVGSQVRVSIRTDGPEEAVVTGSIDRDAIAEAIYAHKDEFRLCYEREINAEHPNLSGQIGTSFVIGSSGRVTQAGIESSSLHNPNAERCVISVLKRIEFPMPAGGGIVEVHFPFKFSAVGR